MLILKHEVTSFTLAGYVADFCPICGAIRRFSVEEEEAERHLHMLPLGEAKLMSTRAMCTECGQIRLIDPSNYARFIEDPDCDLDELVRETNPQLADTETDCMKLWARMNQSPESLSDEDQQGVVNRVVAAVRSTLELRHAVTDRVNIRLDPPVAMAIMGPFLLSGLCTIFFDKTFGSMGAAGVIACVGIGFLVLPATCGFAMWKHQKRRLKRQLANMLKTGTQPIKLALSELLTLIRNSPDCTLSVEQIAAEAFGNPGRSPDGTGDAAL